MHEFLSFTKKKESKENVNTAPWEIKCHLRQGG